MQQARTRWPRPGKLLLHHYLIETPRHNNHHHHHHLSTRSHHPTATRASPQWARQSINMASRSAQQRRPRWASLSIGSKSRCRSITLKFNANTRNC
jgi:hypothetical protein